MYFIFRSGSVWMFAIFFVVRAKECYAASVALAPFISSSLGGVLMWWMVVTDFSFGYIWDAMDLRNEILQEHSKAQTRKIADWICSDQARFKELLQLFLHDEYRVVQRAAWVLSVVAERSQELIQPYLPAIVKRMSDDHVPVAVKRNVVRMLQYVALPEALHGEVMDVCFRFFEDVNEAIAVRCFSMTVLANLSEQYPEIKNEMRIILEDALENGASAGFRSRAKRTLAFLAR